MEYTTKEFALAMKIVHLQDALDQANKNAKEDGKLGVLPDSGAPSFRSGRKFYARVRKVIKETY